LRSMYAKDPDGDGRSVRAGGFNATVGDAGTGGWLSEAQFGLDQGMIVLMIENYRSDFVWNVMKRNPYIRKGLQRAGFSGGWLDADTAAELW